MRAFLLLSLIAISPASAEEPATTLMRIAVDERFVSRQITWRRCVANRYFDELAETKGRSGSPDEAIDACNALWGPMLDRAKELGADRRVSASLAVRLHQSIAQSFPRILDPASLVGAE